VKEIFSRLFQYPILAPLSMQLFPSKNLEIIIRNISGCHLNRRTFQTRKTRCS